MSVVLFAKDRNASSTDSNRVMQIHICLSFATMHLLLFLQPEAFCIVRREVMISGEHSRGAATGEHGTAAGGVVWAQRVVVACCGQARCGRAARRDGRRATSTCTVISISSHPANQPLITRTLRSSTLSRTPLT
jgi:hypothetical protein